MLNNNIIKFYKEAREANKFGPNLIYELKGISSKEELEKFIQEKVCPIAKSMGYDFTANDLLSYEIDTAKELREEELERIGGGVRTKHLILGGIVSLLTMGGGVFLSGEVHAELDTDTIAKSYEFEIKKLNEGVPVPEKEEPVLRKKVKKSEESKKAVGTASGGQSSEKAEPLQKKQPTTETESDVDAGEHLTAASEGSRRSDAKVDAGQTEVGDLKLVQTAVISQDPGQAMRLRKITDDQKLYALQALNLQDAYALLQSKVIENLRFYGNLSEIKFDENEIRQYSADKGDAISEILFQLFPSPAGVLNTAFNGDRPSFSKNPITPELMAKICAILNDYRNGRIVNYPTRDEKKIYFDTSDYGRNFLKFYKFDFVDRLNDLEAKFKKISNEKSDVSRKIKKLPVENLSDIEQLEKKTLETAIKEKQKILDEIQKEKITVQGYCVNLQSFISILMDAVCCETSDLLQQRKKDIEEAKTKVDDLISAKADKKFHTSKLKEQVEQLEKEHERLEKIHPECTMYPQYLTEKILMSYLIKTLDTREDVEKFYSELTIALAQNKTNELVSTDAEKKQEVETEKARLDRINKIIGDIKVQLNSPYKNEAFENNAAKAISFVGGEVGFYGSFPDCADTALRHVVNLLLYSENQNWDKVLANVNEKDINEKLEKVKQAINGEGLVKFYDLKTRLQMFFLYQRDHGVDDQSDLSRTLWEYAICGMNSIDGDMYEIRYCNDGYELNTGYINMMKALWNIANALELGEEKETDGGIEQTKLQIAQKNINELGDEEMYEGQEDAIRTALESACSLFTSEEIDVCSNTVSCNGVEFIISQSSGHAQTVHKPLMIKNKYEFYECDNSFLWLLLKCFCPSSVDAYEERGFYGVFSRENFSDRDRICDSNEFRETDLYKKHKALSVYRSLQGEENNYDRIYREVTKDVLDGANLVNIKSQGTLLEKLYKRFLNSFKYAPKSTYIEFNDCALQKQAYNEQRSELEGLSYIKLNDTEVRLFVKNVAVKDDILFIPSKVYDDKGNVFTVVSVDSLEDIKCRTVNFDDNFRQLTIDFTMFLENESLQDVNLPEQLTSLTVGTSAFADCTNLKNFNLSKLKNLENLSIGSSAFYNCGALNGLGLIKMSNINVLSIGNGAFGKCASLSDVIIPTQVKSLSLGRNVFEECSARIVLDWDKADQLENLSFGPNAFNKKLTEIVIPSNVKSLNIGVDTFCESEIKILDLSHMKKLETLHIGTNAFWECKMLTDIIIPSSVKEIVIEENAFIGCDKLSSVVIPSNVKSLTIKKRAFNECHNLSSIVIPSDVKSLIIEEGAFLYCKNLQSIKLPMLSSLENLNIKKDAFKGWYKGQIIVLAEDMKDMIESRHLLYGIEDDITIVVEDEG